MNNLRTHCIYALIILFFSTAITIIEFIHFNNQTWHHIAYAFLFPTLSRLITASATIFIIAPCISKRSQQQNINIATEENNSTQPKGEAITTGTAHHSTNEADEDIEQIDKGEQTS